MLRVRCSTLPKLQATSGVCPSISSGEVPHWPYADDTILLIENDEDTILIVKLLLYYYEAIIEFKKGTTRKVKFLAWGIKADEQTRTADLFSCDAGGFPSKYLGLPVGPDKTLVKDLILWLKNWINPSLWSFNSHISSDGKSVLINPCLNSIPRYAMGSYLFSET
jgi:hypothetical protein